MVCDNSFIKSMSSELKCDYRFSCKSINQLCFKSLKIIKMRYVEANKYCRTCKLYFNSVLYFATSNGNYYRMFLKILFLLDSQKLMQIAFIMHYVQCICYLHKQINWSTLHRTRVEVNYQIFEFLSNPLHVSWYV